MNRLDSYTPGLLPLRRGGEVGEGAEQFSVGQLSRPRAMSSPTPAEVNWVPTNLCVPVAPGATAQGYRDAKIGGTPVHGLPKPAT